MSSSFSLEVQPRELVGKKVKWLRQEGILPATVYGKSFAPVSVQMDERTFNTIYRKVGHTTLVDLQIAGQPKTQPVFVHDVQRHPVSRSIIHAEFLVVDLKVAINTEVPIVLVGTSPVAERGDAVINHSLAQVMVHALPSDLPPQLEIDISQLNTMDKSIYVRDLKGGAMYDILTNEDELVVSLTPIRARLVEEEEEEEAAEGEPELIRREQEEESDEGK